MTAAPSTAPSWRSDLLPRLAGLPLLPVGAGKDGKAPIDIQTGLPMTGWQSASWAPAQIAATNPAVVTAVGMRCGPDAGGLVAFDLDGESAIHVALSAGCQLGDAGWLIQRLTAGDRCKVVFRVPPEQWPATGSRRAGKVKHPTGNGEQIEVFFGSGQIVVAGLHKPSGAFLEWRDGPEQITDLPPAWLALWESMEASPEPPQRPAMPAPVASHLPGDPVPLLELLPAKHEALARSGCAEGGRDEACFELAAVALATAEGAAADGLEVAGTVEELVLQFAARCNPPFPEREALKCLRSAERQERTPDAGLDDRIAYQRRKGSRGSSAPSRQAHGVEATLDTPAVSVATADAPKLPAMPVAGGGKRLRLAPDEVLKRLPQMLGTVRLNIRTGDVVTEAGGVLSGNQISRLYLELSSAVETWPKDATSDAVITLAGRNEYDPVQEYLEGIATAPLPMEQWQRLDHYLLGLEDPIARAFLPRYLIGAVARTMAPGCYVRQTPVLIGPQERGKTELGRILFGADHWVEGVGALDRDALQRAHMAWGVELAELDGVTRRRDQEQLKAFLTEQIDTYQIRYDRCPERHPRRFVFWATANRPPLRDSTGSTRFVCIPIPDRMLPLDWARQHRDALWARALEQYRSGVTWLRTDEQERQEVEARNASFMELDPWADSVEEYLAKRIAVQTPDLPVKVQQLLMHLEVPRERHNNHNAKRVQEIAERLGWKHGRRRWAGNGPREGLWPPEPAVHPVHPVHPGVHPACTPADPLQSEASGPAVHPVHPISSKGSTKKGEQAGTGGNQESSAHDAISECTGCTPHQTADGDRDSVVHSGVHSGVHRGVQRGAHPDRIACSVDGNPGWTRKAGPMRGASVLVTDPAGHSQLVGREQITDLP